MTKHRVLFFIVVLALAGALLAGAVYVLKKDRNPSESPVETPVENQERPEVTHLIGTVKSVSEDAFVLEVTSPSFEDSEFARERTVIIGPDTAVGLTKRKDPGDLARESEEFNKKVIEYERALANVGENDTPLVPPVPPLPIVREGVDGGAFLEGQSVSVVTIEDVYASPSFTPASIEILP